MRKERATGALWIGRGSRVGAPELARVDARGWTGGLPEPRPEGLVAGERMAHVGRCSGGCHRSRNKRRLWQAAMARRADSAEQARCFFCQFHSFYCIGGRGRMGNDGAVTQSLLGRSAPAFPETCVVASIWRRRAWKQKGWMAGIGSLWMNRKL